MSVPPDRVRETLGRTGRDGVSNFEWRLTDTTETDFVRLVIQPRNVLPVIFVPGIMGSNLKQLGGKGGVVWRLDNGWFGLPVSLMKKWIGREPGLKQRLLHPDRVEVDKEGATPSRRRGSVFEVAEYRRRGWGEVGEASYHSFLLWLEETLNGQGRNPALWNEFYYTSVSAAPVPGQPAPTPKLHPGIPMEMRAFKPQMYLDRKPNDYSAMESVTSDDLLKRATFVMPVYACGYNWLASNDLAGKALAQRIEKVIAENNGNGSSCEQVILVTHSMGGLVARHCQTLPGMDKKIAGVVHGVMPTTGAAVAYRRCKVGMWDEDLGASLVIGTTGQQVTAVFAQAPGALQLLPSAQYRMQWLSLHDSGGNLVETPHPASDPYSEIYLRRDRWWGLIREEWLEPINGDPIDWAKFKANIKYAREFHEIISGKFHECSYVFFGADGKNSKQASFETIQWNMKAGLQPDKKSFPSADEIEQMGFGDVRDTGSNAVYVGGRREVLNAPIGTPLPGMAASSYETSYWELRCGKQDGGGDGTVPISSGAAPVALGGGAIKAQFRLQGFGHEAAYRDQNAQQITLFAVMKIAGKAKVPS